MQLLHVGFGNVVAAFRVVAVVNASSAPLRRLREEARQAGRLIDATEGRKTRTVLVMDSNHIILSALQPETIAQRLSQAEVVPVEGRTQ
ncbi:MAG: DUF370 domain-containing protein [Deltaproteobacteria bacterium]|nr:MAG: DUF370 domain-containing protein [Deltaproteobacteria bacterium]